MPRRSRSASSLHRNRRGGEIPRWPVGRHPARADAAFRRTQPGRRSAGLAQRPHYAAPEPGDHRARDGHHPDSGDHRAPCVLLPVLVDRRRDHPEADRLAPHPASLGRPADRDRDARPSDRDCARRGNRPGAGHVHSAGHRRCRAGTRRCDADPREDRRSALPHAGGQVRSARPATLRPAKGDHRGHAEGAAGFARGCSPGRGSARSSGHGRGRWNSSSGRLRHHPRAAGGGLAPHRGGDQPVGAQWTEMANPPTDAPRTEQTILRAGALRTAQSCRRGGALRTAQANPQAEAWRPAEASRPTGARRPAGAPRIARRRHQAPSCPAVSHRGPAALVRHLASCGVCGPTPPRQPAAWRRAPAWVAPRLPPLRRAVLCSSRCGRESPTVWPPPGAPASSSLPDHPCA